MRLSEELQMLSNERLKDGNERLKTSIKQRALLALANMDYRSHNMFDGVQCEAIHNDVAI